MPLEHMELRFKEINHANAEQLQKQMENPSSSLYGHVMSAKDYNDQFRPPPSEITAIVQWLTRQGLP
jgi:hypothetical protein